MTHASDPIRFQSGDEEGAFFSECGRFDVSLDPVYGYYRLHRAGDASESLAESPLLSDLAAIAARLA